MHHPHPLLKGLIVAGALLFASVLHAEFHTFTDQFGRTVTAEIVSVEGDQVRILREDGQRFALTTSKLTEGDQKFIQKWVAANPSASPKPSGAAAEEKFTPDPTKLVLNLSRAKFDSHTLYKYEGYSHKHENWGYSIQLTNQHSRPLENVRVEYNLFARTYSDSPTPTLITGAKTIKSLASRDSESFRTGSAEVCKLKGFYSGSEGGEMRGIWIRIYIGKQLLIEQSSPESLMKDEKWSKAKG